MSCWVVPSVAAELWGCSIDAVLSGIRHGHLPTREDGGFTFVDVAPNSPRIETPLLPRISPPPTYTAVSPQELEALMGYPLPGPLMSSASEDAVSSDEPSIEEDSEYSGDWQRVRRRVARTRIAPQSAVPLAKAA